MKALVSLGSLALALIPAIALAQQPAACERVEFSEEVLARFPNIRKACLDVISRDGQTFAVVRAQLVRTTSRRMTVRVRLPDGTQTEPMGINVASNARINVNGRMTPITDVVGRPGDFGLRQRSRSGHRSRFRNAWASRIHADRGRA